MSDIKVAKVYAEAIYEIAKKKEQIFPVLEMLEVLLTHIKENISKDDTLQDKTIDTFIDEIGE